ncbi:hypothetical protein BN159_7443 [Streptomyces davaonensis JCM 4913]|uniref:Uncharacterized protein n=1 Tax=Streptomyces davaonensis (strain DSM 101723 / JCM 4913 / KCC S-0913 / 768) TaxID=1214101 RepID=K4RE72_STRDJ|nr:hypothetical protein [Streptomyces davaonensis]CCK31822.1 hypothetical protein BN159_7443 [Streptomyces davaonensis JCM 4913]
MAPEPVYDPRTVAGRQFTASWSALVRSDLRVGEVRTWDPDLLREPRVLVPVDVQALVVPDGGEPAVRLPGPLTPGATASAQVLDGPQPFDPGTPRPAGVHLHWALPDTLLRGQLRDPRPPREPGTPAPAPAGPDAAGGGLGLPPLPDRWAVLRLLAAEGAATGTATPVTVRGWVLDASKAVAWDLPQYPAGTPMPLPSAPVVPKAGLTGAAGGSLTWTGGYDAAFGRFAWHDPLDDVLSDPTLGGAVPGGPVGGKATYLVVGWWSDPELDPLDEVRTEGGLGERLTALSWRLLPGAGHSTGGQSGKETGKAKRAGTVGLRHAGRWASAQGTALDDVARHAVREAPASLAAHARLIRPGRDPGAEASTLLHGAVIGVPVMGAPGTDPRPAPGATRLAFGDCTDEVAGALAATGMGLSDDSRAATERLLVAFTSRLMPRLGSPDGFAEVDQARHAAGFTSVDPGEPAETDRVRTGRATVPPRTRRTASAVGKGGVDKIVGKVTLSFATRKVRGLLAEEERWQTAAQQPGSPGGTAGGVPAADTGPGEEIVQRPAPRRYVPSDPVVAVAGAGRSLRHGKDGRGSQDARLGVRRPTQIVSGYDGVVAGSDLLRSLGSGALPPEAVALAAEALLLAPYLGHWLARVGAASAVGLDPKGVLTRIAAELALRYDDAGAYTAASGLSVAAVPRPVDAVQGSGAAARDVVAERLRRHSLLNGVEPDPVAITAWAQPWVPLWLESEVRLDSAAPPDELTGWQPGPVDLEPAASAQGPAVHDTTTVALRVPLTTGPAEILAGAVARYVADEDERDRQGIGEIDQATRDRLHALASAAGSLDLLGAALDGVRSALLGLPVSGVRTRDPAGHPQRPTPTGLPRLLASGTAELTRARIVDAFGRTLDLDPATAVVPSRLEVPGAAPATLRRPPRLTAPARCRLRPVSSAATTADGAVPARVDEIDPGAQVNPVAGFLLPDHVDESVEVFSADGTPLGELLVEPVGGGVTWEPAPGRPLPPGPRPPGADLPPAQAVLGRLAAGMVAADATARAGRTAADAAADPQPVRESALSAFLRAVDTTLWTVDPVSGAGSSAVGGIVGRPVAVVTATLTLDVADDLDALELDAAGRTAREAAYRDLARHDIPVRLGEITRSDDGLLGYFLDGDFGRVHLVDRVVADLARESGRGRGHLGTWSETPALPAKDPISHPYLHAEDVVRLRPGVPRLVTLLMLPGSAVHVTAGVVPRTALRLSRAWFAPGLERLSPSVRIGPVLLDPGDVRLPLVAALGDRQRLTTREGPLGWRDDAILAATQAALLPERACVLREGWIRVAPDTAPPDTTGEQS